MPICLLYTSSIHFHCRFVHPFRPPIHTPVMTANILCVTYWIPPDNVNLLQNIIALPYTSSYFTVIKEEHLLHLTVHQNYHSPSSCCILFTTAFQGKHCLQFLTELWKFFASSLQNVQYVHVWECVYLCFMERATYTGSFLWVSLSLPIPFCTLYHVYTRKCSNAMKNKFWNWTVTMSDLDPTDLQINPNMCFNSKYPPMKSDVDSNRNPSYHLEISNLTSTQLTS